ncbi:MAG: WD40/YVTN/BNR-like repeat-containing protein, partial [Blastocatellia bacterium]
MARLRRWILGPLLVMAPAFWSGCHTSRTGLAPTAPIPDEAQQIENTTARDRWFLFQRMYPFNSIPTEARRKAWKALQRAAALNPEDVSNPWIPAGPAPTFPPYDSNGLTSGRINSIAVSPANPQLILIGAADGGIWRSTDSGSTFVPVADDQVDLAVGSIDFSSSDPSTVYAGMGDPYAGLLGTGVLKSTDSGMTWSRVDSGSLQQPGTVSKIKVDPTDS